MLVRIGLLGVSSLLALGMAEAGLRTLDLAPTAGVFTVTADEFEAVPGIFRPGQELIDRRKPALAHRVRIDSLGFRGDPFPREKPPGEHRILFIGDSFTYGDFVDDDETLPAQVGSVLSAACAGPVRAVNAGLGGSTVRDQIEMLRRALVIDPDAVVLTFSENDVTDMRGRSLWGELEANRRAKSRFPLSVLYPALRNTALWNLALEARAVARRRAAARPGQDDAAGAEARPGSGAVTRTAARPGANGDAGRRAAAPAHEELRDAYALAFDALRALLDSAGVPLVFAAYPSHPDLAGRDALSDAAWAVRMAGGACVRTVNLRAPLEASGRPLDELFLLPHDGHPSPVGYAVAADFIADAVLRLRPAGCPDADPPPDGR